MCATSITSLYNFCHCGKWGIAERRSRLTVRASEEDGANGISRKQARKLRVYLVNKLQEWKTALEAGLGSAAAN